MYTVCLICFEHMSLIANCYIMDVFINVCVYVHIKLQFKIPLADEIVGTVGEGAFGKVVECIDHSVK